MSSEVQVDFVGINKSVLGDSQKSRHFFCPIFGSDLFWSAECKVAVSPASLYMSMVSTWQGTFSTSSVHSCRRTLRAFF